VASRSNEAAGAVAAASAIRGELPKLRAALERIEEAVEQLPREAPRPAVARERPERYFRVLIDIYERGGRHGITRDLLGEIGERHGYDRRGLGGFFAGDRAPLRFVSDRARLTAEGLRLVDDYLHEVAR
jgi:hypothetical protein